MALRVVISWVRDACVAFTDVGRMANLMRQFVKKQQKAVVF